MLSYPLSKFRTLPQGDRYLFRVSLEFVEGICKANMMTLLDGLWTIFP